jgi:glycosyltransferase involved in cell wall biosynthesis
MSTACVATNCDMRSYGRKAARLARHELVKFGGLANAFTHVITISQLQYDVSHDYVAPGVAWRRVDNPIDAENPGLKSHVGEDFLFVGRVSTEKGIAHFCEAARRAGVVATIAGDGPLMGELKEKYPDARFLGWKSPSELRGIMRAARVLVFPSVWYEGQPLTVYEALAQGTPVIVSDACAGREAVAHGENGLWFRSADADSLAGALRELGNDQSAARMSANAWRKYWDAPLSMERHLDSTEKVYAEALASAPNR